MKTGTGNYVFCLVYGNISCLDEFLFHGLDLDLAFRDVNKVFHSLFCYHSIQYKFI